MSVINKALQELNKRKSNQQYGKYTPSSVQNSVFSLTKILVIIAVLSCIFLGSVIGYKYIYSNRNISNNEVKNATTIEQPTIEQKEIVIVNEEVKSLNNTENTNNVLQKTEQNIVLESSNTSNDDNKKQEEIEDIRNKDADHTKENVDISKELDRSKEIDNLEKDTLDYVENEYVYEEVKTKPQLKVEYKKLTKKEEIEILNKKANQAIATGNKNAAIKAYQDILALDQYNTSARKSLSSIYYGVGNNLDAIKCLNKGIELQPSHYDYRLYLARIYHSLNQNQQAIKILKKSNPPVNGNVDYYATLANYSREIADYQTAEYAYRRLANSLKDGKWYLGLAIVLEQQNKKSEALLAYKATEGLFLSNSSRKYVMQRVKVLESNKNE